MDDTGYALYSLLVAVVVWVLYGWWGSKRKLKREAKEMSVETDKKAADI